MANIRTSGQNPDCKVKLGEAGREAAGSNLVINHDKGELVFFGSGSVVGEKREGDIHGWIGYRCRRLALTLMANRPRFLHDRRHTLQPLSCEGVTLPISFADVASDDSRAGAKKTLGYHRPSCVHVDSLQVEDG